MRYEARGGLAALRAVREGRGSVCCCPNIGAMVSDLPDHAILAVNGALLAELAEPDHHLRRPQPLSHDDVRDGISFITGTYELPSHSLLTGDPA